MPLSALPRINTNVGVAGHAHPLMMTFFAAKTDKEALKDLILKVPIEIVLRRLPGEDPTSACGPLLPRVRRSPLTTDAVQHLDIVSCWKGLSHHQSLELSAWEETFKESLASQLKTYLLHHFAKRVGQCPNPTDEAVLVSRMIESLKPEQTYPVLVEMESLVHRMILRLYADDHTEAIRRKLKWSLSSGDLPSFVYNFVGTHDCISYKTDRDGRPGAPYIEFSLLPSYSDGTLTISAEPKWQLPKTTFSELPERLSYGEMYRIVPHFDVSCLGAAGYLGFSPYEHSVTYIAHKSLLPLQWDFNQECFHAPVLHSLQTKTIETMIHTRITTAFPHGVRFERVSRHTLKLHTGEAEEVHARPENRFPSETLDWADLDLQNYLRSHSATGPASGCDAASNWSPLNDYLHEFQERDRVIRESQDALQNKIDGRRAAADRHAHPTAEDISPDSEFSEMISHHGFYAPPLAPSSSKVRDTSPGKRKASRPISDIDQLSIAPFAPDAVPHPDLAAEVKRRKREQNSSEDTDMRAVSPLSSPISDHAPCAEEYAGPMGPADTWPVARGAPWLENPIRGNIDSAKVDRTTHHAPSPYKMNTTKPRVTKRTATTPAPPPRRDSMSPLRIRIHAEPSPPHTASHSSTSPPAKLVLPPPSQTEIQRNYAEFEEASRKKAAEKAFYAATVPGFDGVISPTNENVRAFERALLEESGEEESWVAESGEDEEEGEDWKTDDGKDDGDDWESVRLARARLWV